jgi:hypothetical protein
MKYHVSASFICPAKQFLIRSFIASILEMGGATRCAKGLFYALKLGMRYREMLASMVRPKNFPEPTRRERRLLTSRLRSPGRQAVLSPRLARRGTRHTRSRSRSLVRLASRRRARQPDPDRMCNCRLTCQRKHISDVLDVWWRSTAPATGQRE